MFQGNIAFLFYVEVVSYINSSISFSPRNPTPFDYNLNTAQVIRKRRSFHCHGDRNNSRSVINYAVTRTHDICDKKNIECIDFSTILKLIKNYTHYTGPCAWKVIFRNNINLQIYIKEN